MTVISALLGHENLQTTAVYLGLRPESLREAMDKLGESQDEEGNKSSETQYDADHDLSDSKSLRVHVEKLTEAYERLSKAEKKRLLTKIQHWELAQQYILGPHIGIYQPPMYS